MPKTQILPFITKLSAPYSLPSIKDSISALCVIEFFIAYWHAAFNCADISTLLAPLLPEPSQGLTMTGYKSLQDSSSKLVYPSISYACSVSST